ncbi:MAG TPA: LLM class flavin-dependent oxidoreductase [Acidimicrobiia bacterium]|nr:LLM class flavin-dependent oxidoreductase [Acidimicrobiia bacterium]
MSASGRPLKFGYFLIPNAADPLLDIARRAEEVGLDYLGIQDHPYQRRFVDTFALIAAIGAATERIKLFPDVACLPLRPPAVLAKAAASIDLLTGGRFELGLGAGSFWDAIEGYGGPRRSPGESLEALEEAMEVIRLIWSGERSLRYAGEHYELKGIHGGPAPSHDIGLWLGVYGPRALRLAGRKAQGWVPSFRGDVADLARMARLLDEAAVDAGRHPGDIRRILNTGGSITSGDSNGPFSGPVTQWVDELLELAELGFDTFIFSNPDPEQMVRFAEEVVPPLRQSS